MDPKDLTKIWKWRNREIGILSEAHKAMQTAYEERRVVKRTDMTDVSCVVAYENFLGLLVEFNETSGGAFIVSDRPDFLGQKIDISFHPSPEHVAKLKQLHGRSDIQKIEDFAEPVIIDIVRELIDYGIWLCVFAFVNPHPGPNSARAQLFNLMKGSLIDRLSDTFL